MGLIGEISNEIISLDWSLVRLCKTEQEAMRLCIDKSRVRRKQEDIAELLGMNRSSLNTILNADHNTRARYMSRLKQIELQKLCGNRAIDQWAEMYAKGLLNHQTSTEQRKAELLAELRELEQA